MAFHRKSSISVKKKNKKNTVRHVYEMYFCNENVDIAYP